MNGAGTPPPDWDSIFQQARRRMAGSLFLVAAIAAGGTMLLLGCSLQAEGAVSLPIPILNKNDHHKEKQQKHKHEGTSATTNGKATGTTKNRRAAPKKSTAAGTGARTRPAASARR
ncbi:MAG TPA: hypothetical protein VIM28_00725 [Solirubrobacterales bacterium]